MDRVATGIHDNRSLSKRVFTFYHRQTPDRGFTVHTATMATTDGTLVLLSFHAFQRPAPLTVDHTDGIQLTIQLNGSSYSRTYHKSDAVNNVIVLGRLSSTSPDVRFPAWSSLDHQAEVGGFIVSPGRAAFVSPVMSRQHARLVFSGDNEASLYLIRPSPVLPSAANFYPPTRVLGVHIRPA